MTYHTIIVGGGIVGLSTAYQILKNNPGISVCVIEKEDELAQHQSLNNSGVMHSGIYYKPGSLRAKNCFEGHKMMQDLRSLLMVELRLPKKAIGGDPVDIRIHYFTVQS